MERCRRRHRRHTGRAGAVAVTVTVECKRERETDAAVLIVVDDEQVWIPLSQVESMHFDGRGNGTIVISDWIANQKGL